MDYGLNGVSRELYKAIIRKFILRRLMVSGPADLIDMRVFSNANKVYNYLHNDI